MANKEIWLFAPTPAMVATQASAARTIRAESVASTCQSVSFFNLPDAKAPRADPIINMVIKIQIRKYT